MKYECAYCKKIIKDPLMDYDKHGKPYPFCNKKCKNNYVKSLLELGLVLNPICGFIIVLIYIFGNIFGKIASLFRLMMANKKG